MNLLSICNALLIFKSEDPWNGSEEPKIVFDLGRIEAMKPHHAKELNASIAARAFSARRCV